MDKYVGNQRIDWSEIVDRHHAEIYKFVCRLLGSSIEAEDLTQEIFIRVYKGKGRFATDTDLRGWLFRIARNACIDHCRWWKRKYRERTITSYENHLPDPNPSNEPLAFLKSPISKLPKRQQEVFILRYWHEFTTEETGQILKISSGSVKSHLSRAVNYLKKVLDNEEK